MQDILNQLLNFKQGQLSCNELTIELDQAVKKTLSDHSFRLQIGANKQYWTLFNQLLIELKDESNEPCLISLIKLTRNVVAGSTENQELAFQFDVIDHIEELLNEKMASQNDNSTILQVGTQAICNLITNNSTIIDFYWNIWMTNEMRGLLWSYVLSQSNQDVIMCGLILMINCIRGSNERSESLVKSKLGQQILAVILGDIERLHENESNKNFELSYTIFSELISFNFFGTLYSNIDDYSEKNIISDHQIILLKFLDSKIQQLGEYPNFIKQTELKILINQLKFIGNEVTKLFEQMKSNQSSEIQEDQITNIYNGIVLLFQIINELFILDEHYTNGIKPILVNHNILSMTITILGQLESIQLPSSTEQSPQAGFHFLKRECVRLLGTFSYKDKAIQDEIRNLGGIPLVLAQIKIDDSNPYIREYAILALRNILENNVENQKFIEELEPQQVLESNELNQIGYKPILLENGKVRLKKME